MDINALIKNCDCIEAEYDKFLKATKADYEYLDEFEKDLQKTFSSKKELWPERIYDIFEEHEALPPAKKLRQYLEKHIKSTLNVVYIELRRRTWKMRVVACKDPQSINIMIPVADIPHLIKTGLKESDLVRYVLQEPVRQDYESDWRPRPREL